MRLLATTLVLVLTSCVTQQQESGRQAGNTQDIVSQIFYDQLMNRFLSSQVTHTHAGSQFRKGQTIPYRDGMHKAHKAISACLIWDTDAVTVRHKWASFGSHRDWNYAELSATNGCENAKRQKSLNCTCQTVDHDDVNVLKVPADFRLAYAQLKNGQNTKQKPKATVSKSQNSANTQPYDLFLEWEKTLSSLEEFSISVTQVGSVGTAKSISLIAGKTCDASFKFSNGNRGEWKMQCTDGTNAVGVIQALGPQKGSKGSGYDQDGNELTFRLIPASS
ncbi:hypothetical protein [Sneathiella glossodoripedis]|uniref:hypothetical protein n=1 Tax=Sneathiella glossodoripedis TaxID=418853 RepID=UPI000471725F|nr:hypothetical protein [Sneathiella glossodoripedis]